MNIVLFCLFMGISPLTSSLCRKTQDSVLTPTGGLTIVVVDLSFKPVTVTILPGESVCVVNNTDQIIRLVIEVLVPSSGAVNEPIDESLVLDPGSEGFYQNPYATKGVLRIKLKEIPE